jgi:hypothetical protein
MKRLRVLTGLLCSALLIVFIAGCASSNGGTVGAYNIKDQVTVGKAVWKVLAVEKTKTTSTGSKATGEFVFVQLELKNTSNEATNLTGIEVELVDSENNTYNFDSQQNSTFLTSMGKDSIINGRVEPGETVSGWVAFDIPENAKDVKLRVRDVDVTSSKSALVDLKI